LKCPHEPRIGDDTTATHLYRIAQEAVSNAIRHGKAKHITIELNASSDKLVLAVRDDGIGLPHRPPSSNIAPHNDTQTGIGLQTMRYRAHIIDGVLELRPRPRGGTLVSCTIRGSFCSARPPTAGGYGRQSHKASGKLPSAKGRRSR
jgi:signal transduction histidine kinase